MATTRGSKQISRGARVLRDCLVHNSDHEYGPCTRDERGDDNGGTCDTHSWKQGAGSVICVDEETLEPASFERGRVLIESPTLDRIEKLLDLKVLEKTFPVRVSEVELFLQGPCTCSFKVGEHGVSDMESHNEQGRLSVNFADSDTGNNGKNVGGIVLLRKMVCRRRAMCPGMLGI
ncbi:hypothetical protein GQ457_01G024520 [Hibiscus cannabinus]